MDKDAIARPAYYEQLTLDNCALLLIDLGDIAAASS